MKIEQAIKQDRFPNDYLKAVVNIAHLNSLIENDFNTQLNPFDLTLQQYNILRILKGQKGKEVSLRLVSERMVDRSSNVSRLIDKLEKKKLVDRVPSKIDRRQKSLRITKDGLKLITRAISVLDAHILKVIKIEEEKIIALNEKLNELRAAFLCSTR